jgi:HlyD family secretion protein
VSLKSVRRGDDGKPFVFIVDGSTVHKVPVRLGEASGNRVLILNGLSSGQRVIVSQGIELEDGMQVSVKAEQG